MNVFQWECLIFLISLIRLSNSMKCWQCAAVEGKKCPEDAKSVSSEVHDACIIWRMGNGTILLQNLVRYEEECLSSKVDFWSRFIDLYYQGSGGSVKCCSGDGCNSGVSHDDELTFKPHDIAPVRSAPIQSAPPASASLPGAPLSPFFTTSNVLHGDPRPALTIPTTVRAPAVINRPPQIAIAGYYPNYPLATKAQYLHKRPQFATAEDFTLVEGFNDNAIDGQFNSVNRNGNCQQYFDRVSSEEWLPRILVPLTYDRASETKVGVFYARLKTQTNNNDHIIVRIIDKDKRNTTMYTFKLFQVGAVSAHINRLEVDNQGEIKQNEIRKESVNQAINLTDTRFLGFWITVRNEEISLGKIGSPLVQPIITWNDTLREGPKEPFYFGLTTDKASATFGVNCDVPNLHFSDTCVTDADCKNIPNTVCKNSPVNNGLDPGTRKLPFELWEPRDSLLKSCFCKAGHIRIPESKGCYDPIRRVVTLRDPCFADYHCNDLPNTKCVFDKDVPKYNMSCQCTRGNRPFDADPRTGLIEGCAPLTKEDMGTILGCSTRFESSDKNEWFPKDTMYEMDHDEDSNVDVGMIFVKLGEDGSQSDTAVIRLLDESKSTNKMLTVKIARRDGRVTISESARTVGFFFGGGERDTEKASYEDTALSQRMESEYVGYWVSYQYDKSLGGGVLCVGMSGSPITQDYAIVKWTDNSETALHNIRYMGLTGSEGSFISYGVNCALVKGSPTDQIHYDQVTPYQLAALQGYVPSYPTGTGNRYGQIVTNLNQISPGQPTFIRQVPGQYGTQQTPLVWDYDNSRDDTGIDYATEPETIIEPVLKNQYLTKLKRLLPTFFEDFDYQEIEAIVGNSTVESVDELLQELGQKNKTSTPS